MGEETIIDRIKEKISSILFLLYLKVSGVNEKQYFRQWVGYSQEEFDNRFNQQ